MIRFSVFYPQGEGATFDHEYYRSKHVPLCRDNWNPTGAEIDRGIDGPHVAAVHFLFDSNEDLQGGPRRPKERRPSWRTWPTTRQSSR